MASSVGAESGQGLPPHGRGQHAAVGGESGHWCRSGYVGAATPIHTAIKMSTHRSRGLSPRLLAVSVGDGDLAELEGLMFGAGLSRFANRGDRGLGLVAEPAMGGRACPSVWRESSRCAVSCWTGRSSATGAVSNGSWSRSSVTRTHRPHRSPDQQQPRHRSTGLSPVGAGVRVLGCDGLISEYRTQPDQPLPNGSTGTSETWAAALCCGEALVPRPG